LKIILGKVRPFLRHLTEAHPQVLIIAPTARRLHRSPEVFLERVGAALISRGCPKTW
jgi:hypothetical protein